MYLLHLHIYVLKSSTTSVWEMLLTCGCQTLCVDNDIKYTISGQQSSKATLIGNTQTYIPSTSHMHYANGFDANEWLKVRHEKMKKCFKNVTKHSAAMEDNGSVSNVYFDHPANIFFQKYTLSRPSRINEPGRVVIRAFVHKLTCYEGVEDGNAVWQH